MKDPAKAIEQIAETIGPDGVENLDASVPVEPVVISREQAIKIFFMAINHDDPYWTDLVEDHLVFDDKGDDVIAWPSQWDVGRALGFSVEEMEKSTGMEPGRLKELGL